MSEWISVEKEMPVKKCIASYLNCLGHRRTIIARFVDKYTEPSDGEDDCNDEYCEEKDEYYYCEGWYEQIDNWHDYTSVYVNEGKITHWMPLPEPPRGEEE